MPDDIETAFFLSQIGNLMRLSLREEVRSQVQLTSGLQVADYVRATIGSSAVERVQILYLDGSSRLMHDELLWSGDPDSVSIEVATIVRRALMIGASRILLAHNHPSGDATPSRCDLDATRRLSRAADAVGVILLDHLIVAGASATSLRSLGYI